MGDRRSARSSWRLLIASVFFFVVGIGATVRAQEAHVALQPLWSVVSVTGLTIGSSIAVLVIVARLVVSRVYGLDIDETVEALRGASSVVRENQTLDIMLTTIDDDVLVTAEHRFDLIKSSRLRRMITLRLFTDVGIGKSDEGFVLVVEPDGETTLKGDALKVGSPGSLVREVQGGKLQFEKPYMFDDAEPFRFAIQTRARFRSSDRLIWTVEHISKDFRVRIYDKRELGREPEMKINHHRAEEIFNRRFCSDNFKGQYTQYTYLGAVLPFQGFELRWGRAELALGVSPGAHTAGSALNNLATDSSAGLGRPA